MKKSSIFVLAVATILASGCSHTIEGVQQDAQNNAPVAQAAAQQVGQELTQADKATSGAVATAGTKLSKLDHEANIALLTPQIKADIIADRDFDTKQDVVTVHSTSTGVYLSGHVTSSGLKAKAENIATNVILKNDVSLGVHDQIEVNPG